MKRPAIPFAVAILVASFATAASARDLVLLYESPNHNRIVLDRDSLRVNEQFDRTLQEGMVSLDNSRSTAGVNLYAADVMVQADCNTDQLAVLYARAYAPDGREAPNIFTPTPHELAKPATLFERVAYKGICQSR